MRALPVPRVILPAVATPKMIGNPYPAVVEVAPACGRVTPQDLEDAAAGIWDVDREIQHDPGPPWPEWAPGHTVEALLYRRRAARALKRLGLTLEIEP